PSPSMPEASSTLGGPAPSAASPRAPIHREGPVMDPTSDLAGAVPSRNIPASPVAAGPIATAPAVPAPPAPAPAGLQRPEALPVAPRLPDTAPQGTALPDLPTLVGIAVHGRADADTPAVYRFYSPTDPPIRAVARTIPN